MKLRAIAVMAYLFKIPSSPLLLFPSHHGPESAPGHRGDGHGLTQKPGLYRYTGSGLGRRRRGLADQYKANHYKNYKLKKSHSPLRHTRCPISFPPLPEPSHSSFVSSGHAGKTKKAGKEKNAIRENPLVSILITTLHIFGRVKTHKLEIGKLTDHDSIKR